jgi:hypothetical protein
MWIKDEQDQITAAVDLDSIKPLIDELDATTFHEAKNPG